MQRRFDFDSGRWGGKRRGAGRKPRPGLGRVVHTVRDSLSARTPVHVTLRLGPRLPSLRAKPNHRVVRAALAAASKEGFRVVHCVALSNHVHFVCEADDEKKLARGVQGLCVRLARSLNRLWRRLGKVFDDRYHAHLLRTPREVRNALAYVLGNAGRHGVPLPDGLDPCSSAAWFDGWLRGVSRLQALPGPLPAARSWLLSTGWRRWGLLDPG